MKKDAYEGTAGGRNWAEKVVTVAGWATAEGSLNVRGRRVVGCSALQMVEGRGLCSGEVPRRRGGLIGERRRVACRQVVTEREASTVSIVRLSVRCRRPRDRKSEPCRCRLPAFSANVAVHACHSPRGQFELSSERRVHRGQCRAACPLMRSQSPPHNLLSEEKSRRPLWRVMDTLRTDWTLRSARSHKQANGHPLPICLLVRRRRRAACIHRISNIPPHRPLPCTPHLSGGMTERQLRRKGARPGQARGVTMEPRALHLLPPLPIQSDTHGVRKGGRRNRASSLGGR